VKQPAAQTENLRLGLVEVGDLDVQVKLRLIDHTPNKRLIEQRKLQHVRTVKDHALQLAEHRPSFPC